MVDAIGNNGSIQPEAVMKQFIEKMQTPTQQENASVYSEETLLTEETLQSFINNPAKDITLAHGKIDTSSDIVSQVIADTNPDTVELLNESASVNALADDGLLSTKKIANRLDAMIAKAKQLSETVDQSFEKNNLPYEPINIIA